MREREREGDNDLTSTWKQNHYKVIFKSKVYIFFGPEATEPKEEKERTKRQLVINRSRSCKI